MQFVRGTSELRELDLPCKKHEYIKYKIHYNTAYFDAKKCMFFQFEVMTSQTLDSFSGRDAKMESSAKKFNSIFKSCIKLMTSQTLHSFNGHDAERKKS